MGTVQTLAKLRTFLIAPLTATAAASGFRALPALVGSGDMHTDCTQVSTLYVFRKTALSILSKELDAFFIVREGHCRGFTV
jgi:hypothetical protein